MNKKAAYDTLKPMQISSWQDQLRDAINEPAELLQHLAITPGSIPLAERSSLSFPLRVPRVFAERIQKNNVSDPLLKQVLPVSDEDIKQTGFTRDPLEELTQNPAPGILQKYQGRALLITTGACAIHCRYCFRRHFPYAGENAARQDWQPALAYLHRDQSITEIILSGGDPLALSDEKLADLIIQLQRISHLKRLRIHTRMPVVLPARISEAFLLCLTQTRLTPVVVIHSNHPNEIDPQVDTGLQRLRQAGINVLNQSVLLRDINDQAAVLAELHERLFECGVLPYYLHSLDPVAGAAHFDVPMDEARAIMDELRARLPGYLVPRLVRETPGAPYKIPLL
ncbi:MAG: EF-P beta-lysylation protein EpmB [Gammaproteobacteria bacterium]